MIKLIKIFLFSLCCLNLACADNTPNRVYVPAYSYNIQDVFNNVIIPRGNDFNLLDLLSGNAGSNSRFIYSGDAETLARTRSEIEEVAREQRYPYFLVYTVRPDHNFYSVNNSLWESMNAARETNPALYSRLWNIYFENIIRSHNAWVTSTPIPASQIESANLFTLQDNVFVQTNFTNPNYVAGTASVNSGTILMTGGSDEFVYYRNLGAYDLLPGPLCNLFSSSSMTNLLKDNIDHGVCTQHTYQDLRLRVMKYFIIILDQDRNFL